MLIQAAGDLNPLIETATGLQAQQEELKARILDLRARIGQIEQALASGDAEVFRRAAHSLKSSSASFGAMQFSARAKELELIGKEGNLAGTGEKVAKLKLDYISVHDSLEALRNGA